MTRYRQPITLGAETFPSRTAAARAIGARLRVYVPGTRLSARDTALATALLAHHPEAATKISAGLAWFTVDWADDWGGRSPHLTIHRIDGTSTDVSWRACLFPPSRHADVWSALRAAVADQVIAARDRLLEPGLVCPVTGEALTRENVHVDHAAPMTFDALALGWASDEGGIDTIAISPSTDQQLVATLTDPAQLARWQAFHAQRAVLRLVSRTANLSVLRRREFPELLRGTQ